MSQEHQVATPYEPPELPENTETSERAILGYLDTARGSITRAIALVDPLLPLIEKLIDNPNDDEMDNDRNEEIAKETTVKESRIRKVTSLVKNAVTILETAQTYLQWVTEW